MPLITGDKPAESYLRSHQAKPGSAIPDALAFAPPSLNICAAPVFPMRITPRILVAVASAGLVSALALGCTRPAPRVVKGTRVVLIVWDGLRPDSVSQTHTPTLWQVAQTGVTFRDHHSVYPTLTNVNSTAMATGVFSNRSGLLANYEFRPELEPDRFVRTDNLIAVQKGDELSGGRYLGAATIAEIVQASGGRTAIAGTKTVSLLHDRKASPAHGNQPVTVFSGATVPETAHASLAEQLGSFPQSDRPPDAAQNEWSARALIESLWKDGVPEFSLLWLSEPDRSEHADAPGSVTTLAALKSSDENLAMVLRALEKEGVREQTGVLIASDHGFSTVARAIDVRALLRAAEFHVIVDREIAMRPGDLRVVNNGGTALFYVAEHDGATIARLIAWLQQTDFAGVIFARSPVDGTFLLSDLQLDTENAPDVVMAFRWTDEPNEFGTRGLVASMAAAEAVKGTHGTLSRFDVHNTLIAAGPGFRVGAAEDLPTSNLDLAPTILHLLGLPPPQPLDGRILHEALVGGSDKLPHVEHGVMEATRALPGGIWRQQIRVSKVGTETYYDEGNGRLEMEGSAPER